MPLGGSPAADIPIRARKAPYRGGRPWHPVRFFPVPPTSLSPRKPAASGLRYWPARRVPQGIIPDCPLPASPGKLGRSHRRPVHPTHRLAPTPALTQGHPPDPNAIRVWRGCQRSASCKASLHHIPSGDPYRRRRPWPACGMARVANPGPTLQRTFQLPAGCPDRP